MKVSKLMSIFLAVVMVFVFSACSSGENEDKYVVQVAYGNQPGEPIDQLANKWKELAEKKSNGRLELKLFPSSQLGSEKDVIEQALMGNNTIIFTGYDFLMDYVPDVGILTAPYLTDDFEDLFYLTKTDWFKGLEGQLNEKGIEIVSTNTIYGKRHLMTTKPVNTPEDLKGMKIRVPNNNMYIKTFQAMGATPTPMPLGDMYTSLQQGMIDGAENPLAVLKASKVNEVAKNVALTEHTKIISPWVAGTKFTETLPDDLLKILKETGDEAGEQVKDLTLKESDQVLDEFKKQGLKVTEVDLAPFKEKTKSVYKAFPEWSPNLYETVQDLLKKRKAS